MTPRPLFLLSLPRAGSTLVQRVLASHEEIATAPEPWILLPQVYAMRERGAYTEFGQVPSSRAIREFAERLPGGIDDYRAALRTFVLSLYSRASGGKGTYFLDKTPRYHHVIGDLFELFPEGKFVFLWRNPLAVVASIAETWGRGRWNVEKYRADLFDGLAHLVAGYESHIEPAFAVRFEELIGDPEHSWPPLFEFLELPYEPGVLESFESVPLEARMGDPTGSRRYRALSAEPLEKWRRTLSNPLRKAWCRSYLKWIGEERLRTMGYDIETLLGELDALPSNPRRLGSDVVNALYGRARRLGRRTAAGLLWSSQPR